MVKHVVDTMHGFAAGSDIADIAFDQAKPLPLRLAYLFTHVVNIESVTRRKVVQPYYTLIICQ